MSIPASLSRSLTISPPTAAFLIPARSFSDAKSIETDRASDTPSDGTSNDEPPAPTSESPPTWEIGHTSNITSTTDVDPTRTSNALPASENTPSSSRSRHDDRPSPLLGVGLVGTQLTPPACTNGEVLKANDFSTQLSSDGHSHEVTHPPDYDRPVRLPIDEPELHFAPVPIIFGSAPDATPAAPPDWDGPVEGSVAPPTNDEAGTILGQATEQPPVAPSKTVRNPMSGMRDYTTPLRSDRAFRSKMDGIRLSATVQAERGNHSRCDNLSHPTQFSGGRGEGVAFVVKLRSEKPGAQNDPLGKVLLVTMKMDFAAIT